LNIPVCTLHSYLEWCFEWLLLNASRTIFQLSRKPLHYRPVLIKRLMMYIDRENSSLFFVNACFKVTGKISSKYLHLFFNKLISEYIDGSFWVSILTDPDRIPGCVIYHYINVWTFNPTMLEGSCLVWVVCACLCMVVSNAYYVVFLLCFSSFTVRYVSSFSGLFIFDCTFSIL
jgi:hypothetical protein